MPTPLVQSLKAAAQTVQDDLAASETAATEPRTEVTDALTAAAAAGRYSQTFPTAEVNVVLTKQERNWLAQNGFTVTPQTVDNATRYLVSFMTPRAIVAAPES